MYKIDSNGNLYDDEKQDLMYGVDSSGNLNYIPSTPQNKKKKKNWFENLYQESEGNLLEATAGTVADVGLNVLKGIISGGEGIGDLLSYGAAGVMDAFGNNEKANKIRENAKINATEEIFNVINANTGIDKLSIAGSSADSIANAIGNILTISSTAGLGGSMGAAAGLGEKGIKAASTIASMGSMGASSVGAGMSEAYNEGATDEEALKYGLISGAAEVGSEMLFGGLSKGANAVGISSGILDFDDALAKKVSSIFKSTLAKNLTQYTIKAGGEGLEEVLSGLAQAWGKSITYMKDEDLAKLIEDQDLLEQFITGMVSSGISQTPGLVKSTVKGQDYVSGYTKNEQKAYDTMLDERINEAQEKSDKPLTNKEIKNIKEDLKDDFEKGNIGGDKIFDALGYGEVYNNLKTSTEDSLGRPLNSQELEEVKREADEQFASTLSQNDNVIMKNLYEDELRHQKFNVDLDSLDDDMKKFYQTQIDEGVVDNSTKAHNYMDMMAKIWKDKGIMSHIITDEIATKTLIDDAVKKYMEDNNITSLTTEQRQELENKYKEEFKNTKVNGYMRDGELYININSKNALETIVGHEITHLLEKNTDLYDNLRKSLKEYAESKGEYKNRLDAIKNQPGYNNLTEDAQTKELTADLVGDYIFTSQDYINSLSQNRNLFQKIYDEIKYLVKQVTAGSDEQRKLNKAMKMFEQAYRDNKVKMAEQETSTQPKYSITQDSNGRELTEQQQEYFKDSKVRDNEGRLLEVYHGTNNEFNIYKSDYNEYYFTDNEKAANDYGYNIKKEYLNLTNPYIVDFEGKNDKANDVYENGIFDVIDYAKENGYDGVIAKNTFDGANTHNQYVAFEPNQIKNVDNLNPTSNEDIRYSLTQKVDAELDDLTNEQYEYFKNTKAVNKNGELEVVYHGTPHEFSVFDIEKAGETGLAFGNGFYFTNSKGSAMAYTEGGLYGDSYDQVKEGYINIEKPASRDTKTMTYNEFYNLYNALNENPNMYDDEMGMSNIDALLSDYGDIYNDKENTIKKFYDSYDDDVSLIDNLSYIGNPTEMYKTLRDVTGYDGIIPENPAPYDSFEKYYIAFNPDQFKLKSNKTPTDDVDMNLSLSRNDEIAPTRKPGLTYGEDIELQQTAPIRQDLVDLQNDIAAIKEDYRKQSEDIKKELQALRQEREELDRGVNEVAPMDEYTPVESDIAPYESETAYPNTNVVPLDDNALKKYKNYFKKDYNIKGKQLDETMENIKELSSKPDLTRNDVYKWLKENFGKEEIQRKNYELAELKSELRKTPIGMTDDLKVEMANRYDKISNFRKHYLGKLKLVNYDGYNGLDVVYDDLGDRFYDLLKPDEIVNRADRLMRLAELADEPDYYSVFEETPDEFIRDDADELYSMIMEYRNETNQSLAEEKVPDEYLEQIAPTQVEETIDDYYTNLNNRINTLEEELNYLPKKEYYAIQDRTLQDKINEKIVPEKRDILDLIHQEIARKGGKKVELTKPVVAKERSNLKTTVDTLRTMGTNEFAEISNLAKDYDNPTLVHKADMLNNVAGEVKSSITTAQTDFNGNEIGLALNTIFDEVREKGLEAVANDYLVNWSNIDRHKAGKGSQTPLDISERLVANYEAKYPFLKKWAEKVWQYGKNELKNKYDSGMLSKSIYDINLELYPHYVPFISDSKDINKIYNEVKELKANPIKRAKGGSGQLTPVEQALANYTYSSRLAYRNNELYKEIYNTLNPGTSDVRGAEVGDDFYNSNETLYKNDDGYFLTAIDNGMEKTTTISKELFDTLNRDMKNKVKDVEERLSTILKPVQGLSNIRRKILTTWNPVFLVKNVVKDIQDGLFNSKHTSGLVKNYLPGIAELFNDSTPLARQFKALYGTDALRGQYDDGDLKPKEGLKNNKFIKSIVNANEIMELAPRYAEFKASLEAGDTLEQAMYNAREVTTNFARGGVITKELNRNGFTFLNASVQGFDKFIRNFSGENGAKGIASSLLKALMLGVAPAVFNELVFGAGDDKDEEYDALPDYVKDNYYLIKTGDGNFVRIPKGRALSVFGSAARRTIELSEGEEDAFKGYLSNVNNQIGINNPEENNIFAPLIQAYGSKNGTAWYGGDIVPTRLQDKPKGEQYDASTDKMSIWLGEHLGISPYKLNYVIDQYSGGIGDILLPMITDEAKSNGNILAPVYDQFVVDSVTDNKYVSDFYTKNDELKVQANSSKATDEDYLRNEYMKSISKEMSKLYAERREIQSDNSLSKAEKYEKSQAIKNQINQFAKTGLDNYNNVSVTGNYANVDDMGYYKNAKGNWTAIDQKDITATESLGLNNREMSSYYTVKNDMYNIDQKYESQLKNATDEQKTELNAQKKVDIINSIKNADLPDSAKAVLYDKKYASTETLNAVLDCNIDFNSYLDLQAQNFTADKDIYGKTINGSKKNKVYNYINNLNMPYEQKIMLAKLEYKSDDTYNNEIINYLNNDNSISYQDMTEILKAMGFKVDEYGNITWE